MTRQLETLSVKLYQPKKMPDIIKMQDYGVDLSFDILSQKNVFDHFALKLDISINNGRNKQVGYIIFVKIDYLFVIDNIKSLNDGQIANLMTHSAIAIAIADLRGYLYNATSHFPLGAYSLPSIDMQKLFEDKQKEIDSSNEKARA